MPESKAHIPAHLGLILDGNRRWAKDRGLPTLEGHKKGYENLQAIAESAFDKGVKFISAYVFSTENWKRSEEEVSYLMDLLVWVANNRVKDLDKKNIKVVFIGESTNLAPKVINAMRDAEERTQNNTGGTLMLCLNYGGQLEIASAVNRILADNPEKTSVTTEEIEQNLYCPDAPPVDFIIRTSGEHRISNFMLWRAAYSELYFADVHWPAFTEEDLQTALDEYAGRQRRFGK